MHIIGLQSLSRPLKFWNLYSICYLYYRKVQLNSKIIMEQYTKTAWAKGSKQDRTYGNDMQIHI